MRGAGNNESHTYSKKYWTNTSIIGDCSKEDKQIGKVFWSRSWGESYT